MFKTLGLIGVGLIAAFLVYVGFQSPDYVISREIAIQAPAEKIFPYLNNSKLFESWGPFKADDPTAQMNYSGPDEGVGSKTSWDSQGRLGTASATIVESVPLQKVGVRIEYLKPMQMIQDSEYLLRANGAESIVTWKVSGKNGFAGRLYCVFVNLDQKLGGMFEKGLSNLKTIVEKNNQAAR
jgi:hypothetical protein